MQYDFEHGIPYTIICNTISDIFVQFYKLTHIIILFALTYDIQLQKYIIYNISILRMIFAPGFSYLRAQT